MPSSYKLKEAPHLTEPEIEELAMAVNEVIYEAMSEDSDIVEIVKAAMIEIHGEELVNKYWDGEVRGEEEAKMFDSYEHIETALLARILQSLSTRYMEYVLG